MNSISILIVDDHPVVRRGLRSLLSNYDDFTLTGDVATLAEAQQIMQGHSVDVLLLDIRLKGESGLDLLAWVQETEPTIKSIVLTSFEEDEYVKQALSSGASGYILKSGSDELLSDAIRTVYRNGQVLSAQITERLLDTFSLTALSTEDVPSFNEEERIILQLLVDGASNNDIADALYMSVASVKRRLRKIFERLGVDNRALAIAEVVRLGLLK